MRRIYLALAAISLAVSPLASCAKTLATYQVATSASISRNDVKLLVDGTKTLADLATTYIDGCTTLQSTKDGCTPAAITAIHNALVATRQPRENLVAFAQLHAGAQLGASGLYAALLTAKDSLASVLKQYGYAVPS